MKKADDTSVAAFNKGNANQIEINSIKQVMEQNRKEFFEGYNNFSKFSEFKLETSQFLQFQTEIEEKLQKIH